jgi:hypothetical protein
MSDWKKDLDNKVKQLNLEKGGKDEIKSVSTNRSISSRSNNSISSSKDPSSSSNSVSDRSSSLFRRRISEKTGQINNVIEKGGKGMITVEGALKDLEAIEKEAGDSGSKAVVKALKVVVKFLSTIRSNQLLTEPEKVAISVARKERQAKEVKK